MGPFFFEVPVPSNEEVDGTRNRPLYVQGQPLWNCYGNSGSVGSMQEPIASEQAINRLREIPSEQGNNREFRLVMPKAEGLED
jgi:hypothetical protein